MIISKKTAVFGPGGGATLPVTWIACPLTYEDLSVETVSVYDVWATAPWAAKEMAKTSSRADAA